MNYIHRLQKEIAELRATIGAHEQTVTDLRRYLLSEKFHVDPTVQVRDVLHRLEQGFDFNDEAARAIYFDMQGHPRTVSDMFDAYYDPKVSDRAFLRLLLKGMRQEVRTRAHRRVRHDVMRECLIARKQALAILARDGA